MKLYLGETKLREQLQGEFAYEALTKDQIEHVGKVFYGNKNALSFYNLKPGDLEIKGIQVKGKVTLDKSSDNFTKKIVKLIGKDISKLDYNKYTFIDLYAGSGNLTYHIAKELRPQKLISADKNPSLYSSLKQNLLTLKLSPTPFFFGGDLLANERLASIVGDVEKVVVFVDFTNSNNIQKGVKLLDLTKTYPSFETLISLLRSRLSKKNILFTLKLPEKTNMKIFEKVIESQNLKIITKQILKSSNSKQENLQYFSLIK